MRVLDIGIGLLLPVWLLGFERILFGGDDVFFGSFFGGSILGDWRPAAYAGTAGFVLALTGWLVLGRAASFVSGALAAGSAFALVVGLGLLPLSVPGVFVGLGLLGLSPFATAWVYSRCARDAWRASGGRRLAPALLGFLLALALPLGAQLATERTAARALVLIEADDPATRQRGIELLRLLRHVHGFDEIVSVHQSTNDATRKQRMAEAFRGMTGWEIEDWLATMAD